MVTARHGGVASSSADWSTRPSQRRRRRLSSAMACAHVRPVALAPGARRLVPEPRLVRRLPGAGARGAARLARPPRGGARPLPRARARGPPRRGARGARRLPRRRSRGPRLRAQRHAGHIHGAALAALRGRRRAARQRPRVQRRDPRACAPPPSGTARGSSSCASPSRSTDPSQVVEADLEAVTPRTRLALVDHVTRPTALVLPVAAIVRELDRRGVDTLVDGAHAPGMVPLDLDGARRRLLDRQLPQVAVRAEGRRLPVGPRGPARRASGRWWSPTASTTPRTDRSRFRLEFDWTGTDDPTPYLAIPAALRFVAGVPRGRLDRAHGRQCRKGAGCSGRDLLRARGARAGTRHDARRNGRRAAAEPRAHRGRCRTAAGLAVRRRPHRGARLRLPGARRPGRRRGTRRASIVRVSAPGLQPAGRVRLPRRSGSPRGLRGAVVTRARCWDACAATEIRCAGQDSPASSPDARARPTARRAGSGLR